MTAVLPRPDLFECAPSNGLTTLENGIDDFLICQPGVSWDFQDDPHAEVVIGHQYVVAPESKGARIMFIAQLLGEAVANGAVTYVVRDMCTPYRLEWPKGADKDEVRCLDMRSLLPVEFDGAEPDRLADLMQLAQPTEPSFFVESFKCIGGPLPFVQQVGGKLLYTPADPIKSIIHEAHLVIIEAARHHH